MAEFIREGEMIEGQKCSVSARRIEFKKGGLRKDPVTDENMVLYELDRNCSSEVVEARALDETSREIRNLKGVHCEVGDKIRGDAIRLYVASKRDVLRPVVKEGQSGRHGASVLQTTIRTIGKIKTPLQIYAKLLGYSANSIKQIEGQL